MRTIISCGSATTTRLLFLMLVFLRVRYLRVGTVLHSHLCVARCLHRWGFGLFGGAGLFAIDVRLVDWQEEHPWQSRPGNKMRQVRNRYQRSYHHGKLGWRGENVGPPILVAACRVRMRHNLCLKYISQFISFLIVHRFVATPDSAKVFTMDVREVRKSFFSKIFKSQIPMRAHSLRFPPPEPACGRDQQPPRADL